MAEESVILVDECGNEIGAAEKLAVHLEGSLHRAFSIFVFGPDRSLLVQRRALEKYHSGGLWSNTCCGHPRPAEALEAATCRRLREEMGFVCSSRELFRCTYYFEVDRGLIEHEYNHVFVGSYSGQVQPDASEVMDYRWVNLTSLGEEIRTSPEAFSTWFKLVLPMVLTRDWTNGEKPFEI